MGRRRGKFSISRSWKTNLKKFDAPELVNIRTPDAAGKTGIKSSFADGTTMGELAYSSTTKRLYVWNGSVWQFISSGRQDELATTIATSSGNPASLTLTNSSGTVTMTAENYVYASEIQNIVYSYHMYDADKNYYSPQRGILPNQIASISGYETSGVFTITPNSPHENKVFTFVAIASDGRIQVTYNISLAIN